MGEESAKCIGGSISCIMCLLVVGMIWTIAGAGTVEPVEYGIVYAKVDKSIVLSEGIKTGGWYFIGWFHKFITFPATQVNMDFTTFKGAKYRPVQVYDKGGQKITVSFSLQYKLDKKSIIKLYNQYLQNYERKFEQFIKQAVTSEVGKFNNTIFWTDRKSAGKNLLNAVNLALNKQYATAVGLQILSIDLLRERENTLTKTQVIRQRAFTSEKVKTAKEIRANIDLLKSKAQKQITEIRGKAEAAAKTTVGLAKAQSATTILDATSGAYAQLKSQVKVGPDTGLDEFIYYSQLQSAENTDFLFNVKNAFVRV